MEWVIPVPFTCPGCASGPARGLVVGLGVQWTRNAEHAGGAAVSRAFLALVCSHRLASVEHCSLGCLCLQISQRVAPSVRCSAVRPFSRASTVQVNAERLRLGNLSPAEGAHRDKARKGRGHAAGQVRLWSRQSLMQVCRQQHSGTGLASGTLLLPLECRVLHVALAPVARSPGQGQVCALALRVARHLCTVAFPSSAVLPEVRPAPARVTPPCERPVNAQPSSAQARCFAAPLRNTASISAVHSGQA